LVADNHFASTSIAELLAEQVALLPPGIWIDGGDNDHAARSIERQPRRHVTALWAPSGS
jgi:hypothetical protein